MSHGFERVFAVHTSDEIEARYLLTPDVMAELTAFQKAGGRVSVSFVGGAMCIGGVLISRRRAVDKNIVDDVEDLQAAPSQG